ncbi:hypothetical protein [Burkholderia anthina]|uniref:hypothetical protein n=1 Tax=Burkholderia anthina TaxID=179879 RepID=UPI0012DAD851|nr:hypothetical protein [Burkholderia anthina]
MTYTREQQYYLAESCGSAYSGLRELMLECVRHSEAIDIDTSKEYLIHGAARRLGVMARALQVVFERFPLATDKPLPTESLHDVQINLHAFVINLFGVFENFAWAFVLRHDLLKMVGGPLQVGMFKPATRKHLPDSVLTYLASDVMTRWHMKYLKSYRDALAHRIPLYIPPKILTKEEGERYSVLEAEKWSLAGLDRWERMDALTEEQESIGSPCFHFLHSFAEGEASRPLQLHPQVISDSTTVIEFGHLFLAAWHERR